MREASWLTMGTFASLSLPCAREQQLQTASDITKETFAAVNTALTIYTDTSELAALNRAPAGQHVPLSPLALACLRAARHYAQLSEGAFDYTVAPLVKLWGFNDGTPPSQLPSAAERNRLLTRVGYDRLRLFSHDAAWTTDAMQADLGGVAKGFAVDAAYDRLIAIGTTNMLINLGGNIRVGGQPNPGRQWKIGVRDPFHRDQTVGAITLPSGWSLATSGNYERTVEIDGKRYAHIVDPRTGLPVEGMAGVTVLCPTATAADALSTALFVVGMDGIAALLARLPECEVIVIPDRTPLELWVTDGIRPLLELPSGSPHTLHAIPPPSS
jgi:thiamine biosynthesis lipoprotein